MKFQKFLLLGSLFFGLGAWGSGSPWKGFLSHLSGFNHITWSISFQGKDPLVKNISTPMVPASLVKLITAASALKNLGASTRFENHFEARFDRTQRAASGVRFTVSGDPTWGHEAYESFDDRINRVISELKARGVRRVNGPIAVETSRPELDEIPRPEGWPDRWNLECMATLPSSFMMNGNCGSFRVLSLTRAEWLTPGVELPIHLKLKAGAVTDLSIQPEFDSLKRTVGYTVSGKFSGHADSEWVSSVPVYFGITWLKNLFISALSKNGISYSEAGPDISGDLLSVDLSSKTLQEILNVAVEDSINGVLDRVFFEIAHVLNLGSSGNEATYALLREVVGDESLMEGVRIEDGCGLVVDDRLRADLMIAFLSGVETQPYFSDLLSTLAIAGETGTLADRLTGKLTRGKVFAKTGTIDQFYNLVGYFKTPSRKLIPFAIFSSSEESVTQVRDIIDQLVTEYARLNTSASDPAELFVAQ